MKYRDYQIDIINQGSELILKHRFVYLRMEVRTGKTLTSLGICDKINSKRVLFLTKKKAISSIQEDFAILQRSYDICVTNYESLHKVDGVFDTVILDEAHSMGAFPKPSKRAKQVYDIISKMSPYVILLSGTPTPESYSQMYHQVYGIPSNPFREFRNFYRFSDVYVDTKIRIINGLNIKDYSNGLESIIDMMKPYSISYTQKEAGFVSEITEHILKVQMSDLTYSITAALKRDLVVEGKDEVILADTSVKLMQKMHQLYSGTVIFESGKAQVLDTSKAVFIRNKFAGEKIGVFYKFKAEFEALKQVYGDLLTDNIEEFDNTDKCIALQIVSGREGISLRNAKYLVYYNIDFSATSYWQSRDRMTTIDRKFNDVYWVFSEKGIESQIYKAVTKKKDYTLRHFKKDFL